MKNCLCIIMFLVLSLTIPVTSAYAYGGDGDGDGDGDGIESTSSDTTNPPSGFTPVEQESAEITTSSETDPGNEEEVAELVEDVNAIEDTTEEGDIEGDSADSSEETRSDETTPDEDQGDERNLSDDGTDKTGNITNGVRLFLSQIQQLQSLPQGLQPAADAVNQAADRTERVEHINNFCHEAGFDPPDLSDNQNLVTWENIVKEAESNIEIQNDRERNLAAAAEYERPREELLHEREEQIQSSCEDVRAIVKFGMDLTATLITGGIGGIPGAVTSIVYSASTSDDPVKGGVVQAAVEVVTYGMCPAVNFVTAKTEEIVEYGLSEVSGRQQQREQFEQQRGQSIDRGVQSVPPSK